MMTTFSSSIQMAVETLFEGFLSSETEETAWARRLMRAGDLTDWDIAVEVSDAIATFCPNLPDEHIPLVLDILSAGIRVARQQVLVGHPQESLA